MEGNPWKGTDSWRLFWAVELLDMEGLEIILEEFVRDQKDVGIYFDGALWSEVFSGGEQHEKPIRVCMGGGTDFSPLQHACDVGWANGMRALIRHKIGCSVQGKSLPTVDIQQFLRYAGK